CQACKDRIEISFGTRMQDMQLEPQRAGRRAQVARKRFGQSATGRVDEHGYGGCRGQAFVQELEPRRPPPFGLVCPAPPGSAGTAQACDKSHLDRVNSYTEDNRNRCSRGLCRKCGRSATGCRNHCHLTLNQLRRKRRQSLVVTLGPTVFDFGVLALNIADLSQTLTKGAQTMLIQVRRCIAEKPDYRYRGRLRPRRGRRAGGRAAEQRDELASSHVEHRASSHVAAAGQSTACSTCRRGDTKSLGPT